MDEHGDHTTAPPSSDSSPPLSNSSPPPSDRSPPSLDMSPRPSESFSPPSDLSPPHSEFTSLLPPTDVLKNSSLPSMNSDQPVDTSSRARKFSEPPMKSSPVRRVSIIKPPSANLDPPSERQRKYSEAGPRTRKISFITTELLLAPRDGLPLRARGDELESVAIDDCLEENEEWWRYEDDQDDGKPPFLQVVNGRFTPRPSCASLAFRGSRASFSVPMTGSPNLASRPSMVSLKQTISRVNLELHPEKGSTFAVSLGQSMASIPTIAAKVYIITQVLAAISVSMGSMAVGFTAGWTSPALESMDAPNSTMILTEEQKSWVGSLMPLSALTSSIVGGYLVDAIGRKMLICFCGPPFILAYILMGAATNVWMLYIGRVIAGFCIGFLTLTLPVYLAETIQAEIRGTLGLLPTTLGNGGILVCFAVGAYVDWWVLAYVGAIIPVIFLLMMIFVPETPRWYISKERDEDAVRALCWLRGTNADVDAELHDIMVNHEQSSAQSSSLRDVFSRRYFKPFAICMVLMSFQQLSGINAVIFYSVSIFKSVGSSMNGNLCSIIIGIVNLFSTFLATALIDRLGRKILLYISDALMVISLISLAAFFYVKNLSEVDPSWKDTADSISWLPLVNLIVYVLGFSLGWGPIPWLFMGEALPAKIRGPAASMVTAFNWACSFVVTKLFPGMLQVLGETGVFSLFACIMIIGTVFSIAIVPETKGMTLEDIEASLMGHPKPSKSRKISEMSGIVM